MRGINLLPWREQYREEQKKKFISAIITSSLCALILIMIIHFNMTQKINAQIKINYYFNQQIQILDKKIERIKNLQEEKQKLINRMNLIYSLQIQRPLIVHLYEGIVKATPTGIYIKSIERKDHLIKITGQAQSNTEISLILRNIESYPWFGKPVLNEIKNDETDTTYSKSFILQFTEKTN